MRIGVISDTHLPSLIRQLDEMGSKAGDILATVDLILHAGDVVAPCVISWCEQFAPVRIARGNNDLFEHPRLADKHVLNIDGWRIGLVHEARPETRPMAEILADVLPGEEVDVFIAGDTHVQRLELRDNVLFMNPGSPTLPHHKQWRLGTVGLLQVTAQQLDSEILVLGQTEGSPNPGRPDKLSVRRRGSALEAVSP